MNEWISLPKEIKELVVNAARNWPKVLDSKKLLEELDTLARRVYIMTSNEIWEVLQNSLNHSLERLSFWMNLRGMPKSEIIILNAIGREATYAFHIANTIWKLEQPITKL